MIISKASLEAHRIGKIDKLPLRIGKDGSVMGRSRKAYLISSPLPEDFRTKHPIFKNYPLPTPVIISADSSAEVYRDIKRDTKFRGLLEHTDVEFRGDSIEDGLRFKLSDGRRPRLLDVQAQHGGEEPKLILRKIFAALNDPGKGISACLNTRRLLQLLESIDRSCSDSTGETPVWMALTPEGDIALRAVSRVTGQRFLGYMRAYTGVEGKAPPLSSWEKSWGRKPKKLPPRKNFK